MNDDKRFPIGKFEWPKSISVEDRARHIEKIAATPAGMRAAAAGFSEQQLNSPYREGGWTVRQVIHHVPESHMNAYIRFKLALTENAPVIKPYDETAWAETAEVASTPIETSLAMLEHLHARWVLLMRGMSEADWKRTFTHPERGVVSLENNLAMYAWHGDHHIAHINLVRNP